MRHSTPFQRSDCTLEIGLPTGEFRPALTTVKHYLYYLLVALLKQAVTNLTTTRTATVKSEKL
jgi:hypothetical protein